MKMRYSIEPRDACKKIWILLKTWVKFKQQI